MALAFGCKPLTTKLLQCSLGEEGAREVAGLIRTSHSLAAVKLSRNDFSGAPGLGLRVYARNIDTRLTGKENPMARGRSTESSR